MAENDIGQKDLAKLLGKTVPTVNQNLNGTGADFSMADIRVICAEYGISCDKYFFNPKVS